jgi:hypothetical protein
MNRSIRKTRPPAESHTARRLKASRSYRSLVQELVAKLGAAGYSQVREIKSSAEGTSAKATKNGKEVSLVVDSSGKIQERH